VNSAEIEEEILRRTQARGGGKSICPSEVARALWPSDWRGHMDEIRDVAYHLYAQNKIVITQGGVGVARDVRARGAIRLSMPAAP
jgi:hypothetical protein